MDLLSIYDIVILDCDGVIMDVNISKCNAFGEVVKGYQENIVEEFVEYCKNSFGVSRYVKFKEFFSEFAQESFQEEKYNKYLNDYANKCKAIYRDIETTPGCLQLLEKLNKRNKKVYVASGSDEIELKEIFEYKGLSKYFHGIYGSPKTKNQCTSLILELNPHKKVVFIGDALSDKKTAEKFGLDFIYMKKYTIQSQSQDLLCKDGAIKVINTLEELIY